jgi:hypothetical protein
MIPHFFGYPILGTAEKDVLPYIIPYLTIPHWIPDFVGIIAL